MRRHDSTPGGLTGARGAPRLPPVDPAQEESDGHHAPRGHRRARAADAGPAPVLNAGNRRWVADLNEAVRQLQAHPDVRVVVLTGAGRAFCTGVDLTELAAGDFRLPDFVAWEDAMVAIERMDRLFIAGINGHCLGGGCSWPSSATTASPPRTRCSGSGGEGVPDPFVRALPAAEADRRRPGHGAHPARRTDRRPRGRALRPRQPRRARGRVRRRPRRDRSSGSWPCHPRACGPASTSPRAPSTWTSTPSGPRCRRTSRCAWPPRSTGRR